MKEIQLPKDFSDRVTLLLSKPGDFSKPRYDDDIQYATDLRAIQQVLSNYYDDKGNLIKSPKDLRNDPVWKSLSKRYGNLSSDYQSLRNQQDSIQNVINMTAGKRAADLEGQQARTESQHIRNNLDKERLAETQARNSHNQKVWEQEEKKNRPFGHKVTDWVSDLARGERDDEGNIIQGYKEGDSRTEYVSKNLGVAARKTADNFAKQVPQLKKAGNTVLNSVIGFKGTEASRKERQKAEDIRKNGSFLNEWRANRHEKLADRRDRIARAKLIGGKLENAGNALSLGMDTISSKHRAQTIAEQGQAGLLRKKARFAQMMGDDSFLTRVAAGSWGGKFKGWNSGMGARGVIGSIGSKIVDKLNPISHRIRSNQSNYQRQLQYMDQFGAFSEQEQPDEDVPNLSWQPDEYAKLGILLQRQYEDFSESEVNDVLTNNFYDASKEVDISSLTPEKANELLSKSYYVVPEDEKRFQESIAKGFSEDYQYKKTYNDFLNECSEIYDSTSWR